MENMFLKLVNMSITASWLILAVIFLRALLKKMPKSIRCILWSLVGIRLIVPIKFESIFSLVPSAETIAPDIMYSKTPSIHTGIPMLNNVINPVISDSMSPNVSDSVNPLQVIIFIASIIWIIGMTVMSLYSIASYLRLRHKLSGAVRTEGNLWQSETVSSPFILGIFRPRIYLPFKIDSVNINYVIEHEKAHIKRGDHFIKPIAFLILTVYWFNPLVWIAYILLCRDIELACDEHVIRKLGTDCKKAYSEALLEYSISRKNIMACPLAFGEVGVKQRIKNILNYKKPAFWIIVIAFLSCLIMGICFLTNPKDELKSPNLFEHTYSPFRTIYCSPAVSTPYNPDIEAKYRLTDALDFLSVIGDDHTLFGKMEKIRLSKQNFDSLFLDEDNKNVSWYWPTTAQKIRRNNLAVWQLINKDSNEFYMMMQQKDGSVYLGYGYYDISEKGDPYSGASFKWLMVLRKNEQSGSDHSLWYYAPMYSASFYYEMPIQFSLYYTHIEAECTNGHLLVSGAYPQKDTTCSTAELTSSEQHMYWIPFPLGENDNRVFETTITFRIMRDDVIIGSGRLEVKSENNSDAYQDDRYTIRLITTDNLSLLDNLGAYITSVEIGDNGISSTGENGSDNVQFSATINAVYSASRCLYISPLSSYIPTEENDGNLYNVTPNSFTVYNAHTGESIYHIEKQQEWLSISQTEFKKMLFSDIGYDLNLDNYEQSLIWNISYKYAILDLDGTYLLIQIANDSIWVIYELSSQSAKVSEASFKWLY